VFLYISWAVWVDLVWNIGEYVWNNKIGFSISIANFWEVIYLIFSPIKLFYIINEFNKIWTWTIKWNSFSWILLWIIWIIEAWIFFFIVSLSTHIKTKEPFCENTNNWCKIKTNIFQDIEKNAIISDLQNWKEDLLKNFTKLESIDKWNYIESELYFSDENNEYYLSLIWKTIINDKEWKSKTIEDDIIKYLIISKETAKIFL